jgi:hypothetical protein
MSKEKKQTKWETLKRASEFQDGENLKVLLMGASGSGKTTAAAKFPRPLIGLTEIQALPSIQDTQPDALIKTITTAEELNEFVQMMSDPELNEYCDSVVLDSVTDCQRILKKYFTKMQGKRGKATEFTMQDTWGQVIDRTISLVRSIRNAPTHSCVICLDREVDGNHRPSVYGKSLPGDMNQFFNIIGFMHKVERPGGLRHEVLFNGPANFVTKTMRFLDDTEPPEPEVWITKRWPSKKAEDFESRVVPRVNAWKEMAISKD